MSTPSASSASVKHHVYSRVFWLSYLANVSLVMANALTFKFADFVKYLGGTERVAGTIVSAGVVGALLARLLLGQAIDTYGTRRLWMLSAVSFVSGGLLFACAGSIAWPIYVGRILFTVGLAGMFTCSMVHIQNQVPVRRRTEVIASLGSSGFVGMIAGSLLGDRIFNVLPEGHARFMVLFGIAAALGLLYLLIVFAMTRGDVHQRPHETPAAHQLILRYWPGSIVLAAMMMGVAFTVYSVFLTRFVTSREAEGHAVHGIGTFFTGYAVSAFVFRLMTRNWSRTMGRHRMVLIGLGGHALACFGLPLVTADWQFLLPAVLGGVGHALLFPGVVSLGAGAFPQEYRGSGTTIVLGFTEVGAMLSAPALGAIIEEFGFVAMFHAAAWTSIAIGVVYAATGARLPDADLLPEEASPAVPQPAAVAPRRVEEAVTECCGAKQ
ncbi:MAG: MFS transporter [Planctomycetales bacterium]